jgi:hypothetical protein
LSGPRECYLLGGGSPSSNISLLYFIHVTAVLKKNDRCYKLHNLVGIRLFHIKFFYVIRRYDVMNSSTTRASYFMNIFRIFFEPKPLDPSLTRTYFTSITRHYHRLPDSSKWIVSDNCMNCLPFYGGNR